MAIFTFDYTGQVGIKPARSAFYAKEYTLAEVVATGFLNKYPNSRALQTGDFVFVECSDGSSLMKAINTGDNVSLQVISNPGEVTQVGAAVVGNLPMYDDILGNIEDSGISAANALLTTTNVTDYQQLVGISSILDISTGTWTLNRIAPGNYSMSHTPADETAIIGIDITPFLRLAAGRGFQLNSIDVVYSVGVAPLDAHSMVLYQVDYVPNDNPIVVTSIPLTGSLNTAVQTNPYVDSLVVTTPAFNNTANTKYVAEITVNTALTTTYEYYSLILHYTKSVA